MLGYFQIGMTGYIQNVPVCADYCNVWFEACKDDLTCVEDWLEDFDEDEDGNNVCPANSTCVTFLERYGNGERLCNRMWGVAFYYSTDKDNCTVMAFNSSSDNPNFRLSLPFQVPVGDQVTPAPTTYYVRNAAMSVVYWGTLVVVLLLVATAVY